jgi:hypothetical protein
MDWFRLYQREQRRRMKDGERPQSVDEWFFNYGRKECSDVDQRS